MERSKAVSPMHDQPGPDPGEKKRAGRPRRTVFPDLDERPAVHVNLRKLKEETGLALPILQNLARAHPDDSRAQLSGLFRNFSIPAATGRARTVSLKTRQKYFRILNQVLTTLRRLNMPVRNLTELSARQVRAVHQDWEREHLSASSLATLNTVLRRLGFWIDKPQLAPALSRLLIDPENGRRSSSRRVPKTWESCHINPLDVYSAMAAECPVAAVQLRMATTFGLRVEEQLMLRPRESHQDKLLVLTRGTKGGRTREVDIVGPEAFALIEEAKRLASKHPDGILASSAGRTLEQARDHYYYLCRKIGLFKKGRFASTPHGARHSFATSDYQRRSGVKAPVLGGPKIPRELDQKVRKEVAGQLGHGRISATAAYIGTVGHLTKLERQRQTRLAEREQLLSEDGAMQALVREARVQTFCLVGPAATGDKLPDVVLVLCESQQRIAARQITAILRRAGELLHVKCLRVDQVSVEQGGVDRYEIPHLGGIADAPSPPLKQDQLGLEIDEPSNEPPARSAPGKASS
jgi:site-specific recombinase XerC